MIYFCGCLFSGWVSSSRRVRGGCKLVLSGGVVSAVALALVNYDVCPIVGVAIHIYCVCDHDSDGL